MALAFSARTGDLNWLFLVEVIIVVIVVLFYLFYFGRLFASIVSLVLRTYIWTKHRAWLDIGSIQFSPLGGRLLFRDVRYVGENQTIRIAMGHITWRYWLWRVRQDDDLRKDDTRLPCRTTLNLEGLEWFIYNRVPAFDALLDRLGHRERTPTSSTAESHGKDIGSVRILPPRNDIPSGAADSGGIDWFREALPITVHVSKGSIVLGNKSTPSLVIAGFRSAAGTCGAVESRSRHDLYKQVYQFSFLKPKIVFRKNHDYEGVMVEHGARMQKEKEKGVSFEPNRASYALHFKPFSALLRRFTEFADKVYETKLSRPLESSAWHGLPRYQAAIGSLYADETASCDAQYAKVSTIYDHGDSIDLTYYADNAGIVPVSSQDCNSRSMPTLETPDIGNGDWSPEWGVDIRLNGGTLTYGPWADRQRGDIQKAFFPPAHFNSEPSTKLQPGDTRIHTALKIYIDFSESTIFRIPTREASKDWRFDGHNDLESALDTASRPYGWLDIHLGGNSSISFIIPMVSSAAGFDTMLEVHLDEISISSSVNYEKFVTAKLCRVSCQLPAPLIWDAQHLWVINVNLEQPEISILRDHTFLFADLIRDWTSGQPLDHQHFVPFVYQINLSLTHFKIHLYLNDRNIINNASAPEDNTLLTVEGPRLRTSFELPLVKYRAPFAILTTVIETDKINLALNPPSWKTHSAYKTSRTTKFASAEHLKLDFSHTVYAVSHPSNVETLDIVLEIDGVVFQLVGWVIKYLLNVKGEQDASVEVIYHLLNLTDMSENYFGNFSHFVTPEEFRFKHSIGVHGDPLEQKHRPGKSDVFEVNLNVAITRGIALLPQELHDCKSAVALDIPEISVYLRNHDYFMDLGISTDPFLVSVVETCDEILHSGQRPAIHPRNHLLVDSLSINSHRLFGPQPRTSVYIAVWEITLGRISGHIPIPTANCLHRAARSFISNFIDLDNALPAEYDASPDPDITFLSLLLGPIDVTFWNDETAVNVSLASGIHLRLDDQAGDGWLSHVDIDVREIEIKGLVNSGEFDGNWLEVTSISGGLSIGIGTTTFNWQEKEFAQKNFVQAQDTLTKRCQFLHQADKSNASNISTSQSGILHLPRLHPDEINSPWPKHSTSNIDQPPELDKKVESYASVPHNRRRGTPVVDDHYLFTEGNTTTYRSLLRRHECIETHDILSSLDRPTFVLTNASEEAQESHVPKSPFPPTRSNKEYMRCGQLLYTPRNNGEILQRIHVSFPCTVKGVVSPAGVKIAQEIIENLEKDHDAEHWLDDLESWYNEQSIDVGISKPFKALHVSAAISTVQLILIQDILRPGDIDMSDQLDHAPARDAAILCKVQLSIRNIFGSFLRVLSDPQHRFGQMQAQTIEQIAALETGKSRMSVKHAWHRQQHSGQSKVREIPGRNAGVVLDVSGQGVKVNLRTANDTFDLNLDISEGSLEFVSSAAELVTGTVHSWFIVSRAIEKAVLKAQYRPLWRYRRFLTSILHLANEAHITTDPHFLNRPTPFPAKRRSDLNWKVLAHIRHCLRQLPPESLQTLEDGLFEDAANSSEDDARIVVPLLQEWHSWELDATIIRALPIFAHLFPKQASKQNSAERATTTPSSWDTPAQLCIHTHLLRVTFFEDSTATNQMLLHPCEFLLLYTGRSDIHQYTDPSTTIRLNLGALSVELDPAFVRLVRHVARVRRVFGIKLAPLLPRPQVSEFGQIEKAPKVEPLRHAWPSQILMNIVVYMETIDIGTQAHGVRASLTLQRIHGDACTTYMRVHSDAGPSGQIFLGCDNVKILAATDLPTQTSRLASTGSTLISVQLQDVHTHSEIAVDSAADIRIKFLMIVTSSRVRIPRSILKMSQFVDHWRSESLPQSKIAFEELRRDLETAASASGINSAASLSGSNGIKSPTIYITANVSVPLASFHIRAAQKFWLDYTVADTMLFGNANLSGTKCGGASAGIRVARQSIAFVAVKDTSKPAEATPFGGDVIKLPTFQSQFTLESDQIDILASIERINISLTADAVDSVLEVQSRFEQDIDELLSVLAKRKSRKAQTRSDREENKLDAVKLSWRAQVALRGLNLGLKGPLSTQFIGADLIDGYIKHIPARDGSIESVWETNALNLALSLAQRTTYIRTPKAYSKELTSFDRNYRLAYFVLDVHAGNTVSRVSELPALVDHKGASHLHVRLPKVHAVMQTAAIEALDGLVEYFLGELAAKRKARSAEVAAIKKRVIQTFDIPDKQAPPQVLPWIERCVLSLRVSNVGIAIPMTDMEIEAPWFGHQPSQAHRNRPAFLLSAPSLVFATAKGNAGFAAVSNLSAQFVSSFDQTNVDHFSGLHHQTHNRLLFPRAKVTIQSDQSAVPKKRKAFTLQAHMSGAEFDLDATIVTSLFALADLYEVSYERLAKHASENQLVTKRYSRSKPLSSDSESMPSFIDMTTFEASFVVDTGIINMHNARSQPQSKPEIHRNPNIYMKNRRPAPRRGNTMLYSTTGTPNSLKSDFVPPDTFVIPKFSLWALKRDATRKGDDSAVHLDACIHSSRNTLYPSLLPFLSEFSDAFKTRMKRMAVPKVSPTLDELVGELAEGEGGSKLESSYIQYPSALRNVRMTFSLRIDRSRLEISCLQAAQVVTILNWQSGGIILAFNPGQRQVEAAVRVEEVSLELKHTFSPERCLGGSAQNIVLSASFAPQGKEESLLTASLDVQSLSGEINVRQLQDFMCFKAVWLDRLEELVPAPAQKAAHVESPLLRNQKRTDSRVVMVLVARLREVKLLCMLGQSIGTLEFTADHFIGRLKLIPRQARSLSLDLRTFKASSKGRLSGLFSTDGLYFENNFHDSGSDGMDGATNFVTLSAYIGQTDAALEFDYRKVLLIQADPIRVGVSDDWSAVKSLQELHLEFSLRFGSLNIIGTTQTVPTMVRLLKDLKKLVEDRRMKARMALFSPTESAPPTDTDTSKTSSTDIGSAETTQIPSETLVPRCIPSGTKVVGTIQLEAERLRLAIFLHHFSDAEAFRGDAGAVRAVLQRGVSENSVVNRDLQLHLGFFIIRKLRPKKVSPIQEREYTIQDWFDHLRAAPERNIFNFPTSEAKMSSTQKADIMELYHRFSLIFTGQVDISLNYALLKQLGELKAAYQEGMRRAGQTDFKGAPSSPNGTPVSSPLNAITSNSDSDFEGRRFAKIPPPQSSTATIGSLKYIAQESNIQQPQLQLLGDATPPMEWLGVQRDHFPAWIHEGVTTNLEHVLLELTSVYRKGLAGNASVNS